MQQWMLGPEGMSVPVCEMDFRPGGKWHYEWQSPDGSMMEMNGVFKEILPGEKIVQTENWGGDLFSRSSCHSTVWPPGDLPQEHEPRRARRTRRETRQVGKELRQR